uniref:Uncharacterized protein n=1 Tax=Anguilla anguilla TaxID=7936 RepID=A0A0E9X7B2_ANGAN
MICHGHIWSQNALIFHFSSITLQFGVPLMTTKFVVSFNNFPELLDKAKKTHCKNSSNLVWQVQNSDYNCCRPLYSLQNSKKTLKKRNTNNFYSLTIG